MTYREHCKVVMFIRIHGIDFGVYDGAAQYGNFIGVALLPPPYNACEKVKRLNVEQIIRMNVDWA